MTEAELAALMRQYNSLVWTVVSGILHSREACEEAAADVFITLWKESRFDPSSPGVKSYIITLAMRRAIDRLRAESRHAVLPLDELCEETASDTSLPDEAEARRNAQLISEAISSLPSPDAEIITRRYYYSQTPASIASALKLSRATVNESLRRSCNRVRELLLARGIDLELD